MITQHNIDQMKADVIQYTDMPQTVTLVTNITLIYLKKTPTLAMKT